MLHDIGRFEQIRRFGTFNDAQSVDHAEFGADLLFKECLIRKFAEGYYEECELAQSYNQSDYCQEERKIKEFLVNNDATTVDDEQIGSRIFDVCENLFQRCFARYQQVVCFRMGKK